MQFAHLASISAFRPQVHFPVVFEHCPVLFSRAGVIRSPGWLTRSSCISVARSFSNPTLWCSDLRRHIGMCGSPFCSGFSMPGTASLNVLQSLTLVVTGRKATHTLSAYQAGFSLASSWFQVQFRLVLSLVSSWFQAGFRLVSNLVSSWLTWIRSA